MADYEELRQQGLDALDEAEAGSNCERDGHRCSMWYGYCLDCGEEIPWGLW